jgi:hypothetical protein
MMRFANALTVALSRLTTSYAARWTTSRPALWRNVSASERRRRSDGAGINRLVSALASGAAFEAISAGLKDREAVKQGLQARAEHLQGRAQAAQVDREALRETLTLWRGKLAPSQVAVSRQVLAKLLPERIKVNLETGAFSGPASFGYLISMGKSWSDARPSVTPRA